MLAHRVHALNGFECRANIHRLKEPAILNDHHLAAACSNVGLGASGGNGVGGTSGVPI